MDFRNDIRVLRGLLILRMRGDRRLPEALPTFRIGIERFSVAPEEPPNLTIQRLGAVFGKFGEKPII